VGKTDYRVHLSVTLPSSVKLGGSVWAEKYGCEVT